MPLNFVNWMYPSGDNVVRVNIFFVLLRFPSPDFIVVVIITAFLQSTTVSVVYECPLIVPVKK